MCFSGVVVYTCLKCQNLAPNFADADDTVLRKYAEDDLVLRACGLF